MWMERLKQFMGFPLLATNLWLLWVIQNQRGSEAVLLLLALFLVLGFCAWIYGASRGQLHLLIALAMIAVISSGIVVQRIQRMQPAGDGVEITKPISNSQTIPWVPYSPEALQALRDEGKPIFLDFTASWCLTCQFNERTAIDIPSVRKLMKERGITAMKGDWTNSDPAITTALKSFGRVGVPLAVFYPQGRGSDPVVLPELLTEKIMLETLGR
jgi:thiol:disulfide interchange protein DsbD